MNVFCTLQEYRRKMAEKTHQVAKGNYDTEKKKGEATASPSNNNH